MKSAKFIIISLMVMLSLTFATGCDTSGSDDSLATGKGKGVEKTLYDFSANLLGGEEISLDRFRGKVVLVVNTASKCGFTPQYAGLEKIYKQYKEQGFEVLGFPCNQFAWQEPGSADEIAQFCKQNYGVSFTMFDKINVNGKESHPLYQWLKQEFPGNIKWNFTKFLIDQNGKVINRYGSSTTPADIAKDIEVLLNPK